jgi:PAS domain S-box-containing protein
VALMIAHRFDTGTRDFPSAEWKDGRLIVLPESNRSAQEKKGGSFRCRSQVAMDFHLNPMGPIGAMLAIPMWVILTVLFWQGISKSSAAETRPLLFLGDRDYPPICYLDQGVAKGLDVDLASALAKHITRPIRVELMDWEVAQKKVLTGEADGLLGMTITEERKKLYDFADATFTHEFGLFVRTGLSDVHGLNDLAGKNVGVTPGGLPRSLLESRERVHLVFIKNYREGFEHLANGGIDVLAADSWVGSYAIQANGIKGITVAGEPFGRAPAAIAVKRGNAALLHELNNALAALNDAGALSAIQEKWRPQEVVFVSRAKIRNLQLMVIGLFLLFVAGSMAGWVVALKRQIRTRHSIELALRESEQRYKCLAESAPHGILVTIENKLVYANPAAASIVRAKTPAELIGRDLLELAVEESREQIQQRRKRMLETGAPSPVMRGKALRLDGTVVEFEGAGAVITYGGERAIQNTFVDITEQIRTEEALNRQVAFQALINELLAGFTHASASEMDEQIYRSLGAVGRFVGVDYAFVDQIAPGGATWSCTHEWCNQGMPSKQSRFQNIPMGTSPWTERQLISGETVQINRLQDFPPEAAEERRRQAEEGIRSSLHVPLRGRGGMVNGCVGLLSVTREAVWAQDDIRWLKVLSDTIANALERKRTEEALRLSETRYRTLFESAQDAIFLMEDGKCTDCNPMAGQLFGCRTDEIIGQTPIRFSPSAQPDNRDSEQKAQEKIKAATDGLAQRFEWRHRRLDGSDFDAEVSLNRLQLGERNLLLAIVRDITERKRSEERFSRIFRKSPIPISLLDLSNGRFLDVNESFLRMSGFTRQEVVGRTSLELGLYPDPGQRALIMEHLHEFGHLHGHEQLFRAKTGEIRNHILWFEVIAFTEEKCLLVMGQDVTEQKQAERRVQESREQLRALSSRVQSLREEERTRISREIHDHLGQLLTALKLDLRSLERKVSGLAELALRTVLNDKIVSARELADEMITSVQKIASELRPGILDRLGLAAAIEVEAQAFQSRTGIHCRWTLLKPPGGASQDLATAAFRIFQEILTNVARHAHATEIEVRLDQRDGNLILEVGDNGIGIQSADIDNPKSLGLLGMKERAAILGGEVTLSTNSGNGTMVKVHIPVDDNKPSRA